MSESLSEEELAELIRHGRINTSRSMAKRRQPKPSTTINIKPKAQVSVPHARKDSSPKIEVTEQSVKEPDSEWLKSQKEKAERNISAPRQDKQRRDEMQEASKF